MTLRKYAPWLVLVGVLGLATYIVFSASDVFAQSSIISPECTGLDCQFCNLLKLADKLIKYLIYAAAPIAACLFAYAGFIYLTSGGSSSAVSKAKTIFTDILFGMILALLGFVIIDTIIQSLAAGYFKGPSWSSVQCIANDSRNILGSGVTFSGSSFAQSSTQSSGLTTTNTPGSTLQVGQGDPLNDTIQRGRLQSEGIPVTSSGNCSNASNNACTSLSLASSEIIQATIDLKNNSGFSIAVSGGNEVGHQDTRQQNGTSVDISFQNASLKTDASAINTVLKAAQANGQCAVWEPGIGKTCPTGVTNCLTGYGSDGHFSLYLSSTGKPYCN